MNALPENEGLKKRVAELEEQLRVKDAEKEKQTGHFMLMSHQLRAPLVSLQTVIKGIVEGITDDPEVVRRLLGKALARGDEMLDTINEMIVLGQLYSGGGEDFVGGTCEAVAVLVKCVETVSPSAAEKNIEIQTETDASAVAAISERALEHVFINLVENAVKYSYEGSTVHAGLKKASGGKVVFTVEDEGIGIPEEAVSGIFDEFTRADNAKKHAKTGTGLGMPIVKKIVEKVNGKIIVESEAGKGTRVEVIIPATGPAS